MYRFVTDIAIEDYTAFTETAAYTPIQQTPQWSQLKNNWDSCFCGVYRDEVLVCAALVLLRRLMPGFTMAFCPMGPVGELCDGEVVRCFVDGMRGYCRKKGVYLLKIAPPIAVDKTLPDMEKERYLDAFDVEKDRIAFDALVGCGLRHKGFPKDMGGTVLPRYQAMIPLKDAAGAPLSAAQFKKNYKSKLRKYLGAFRPARGLYYETAQTTPDNIALFKKILSATEARQNIALRNEEYFALLAKVFGEDAHFAFEKCAVDTYIENLKVRYEKEPEMREKIAEQLADAESVRRERGAQVPLAALLTVYPGKREGLRVAEYLYAGADLSVFPSFCATLCGLFDECERCVEKGCDYLNLGGLPGTFDDGLYDFKAPFNPIIVEYAGEFDLPVIGWKYTFMERWLPTLKKWYRLLRR